MFIRYLPLLALCAPAGEQPDPAIAGAATPPAGDSAPPAPETTPESIAAGTPPASSVFAQAKHFLSGIGASGAQITTLRADLTARDATIASLQADLAARDATIAAQLAELNQFRIQAADLQTTITALQSQQKDVQTEVIHQLAASGLPESALPQSTTAAAAGGTYEDLVAAAESEADPRKKGDLMNRAFKAKGIIHDAN